MTAAGGFGRSGLRVVLADDAPFIRQSIALVLSTADIEVVAEVSDAPALLAAVADLRPDIAITDIRMPPDHRVEGLQAAIAIQSYFPGVATLLLSNHAETKHLATLLDRARSGVGYLLKERVVDTEAFIQAVLTVADQGTAVDPQIIDLLVARRSRQHKMANLSPRETQVLHAMAAGLSNLAITQQLHLSPKTVDTHIHRIFDKLNMIEDGTSNRRVQAVLACLQSAEI